MYGMCLYNNVTLSSRQEVCRVIVIDTAVVNYAMSIGLLRVLAWGTDDNSVLRFLGTCGIIWKLVGDDALGGDA